MSDSGPQPYKGGYYLWSYVPSLAAAIVFAVLFIGITAAHCYGLWKSRLWFCIWFIIGGLMEIVGFCARASASSKTGQLMPYVIQNLFLLLPPVLFAATAYMVLGRVIRSVNGERYSLVKVRWLTKVFVAGDVLSFMIQGGAAGLMATGGNMQLGERLVVVGLLIQVVLFGCFCATAGVFHYRFQRYDVGVAAYGDGGSGGWRQSLYMLYAISGLIMVRSVFRVIEYSLGHDGYPLTHEWTLYVFDSVLMLAVMVIFHVWNPSPGQYRQPELLNLEGVASSK
ncbi:RTA1 like protein [Cercophora scortea]|uniref:RTA1 like protein n=1 Tax=Cercophora scortea TaxID=314031 RepID=A0AAE0IVR1_9PEZI|nr:RTA1 like protein [Cercophora scortea]